MKKIIVGLLLFSSVVFSTEWVKDLSIAFQIAKKEHKNVMVMVESENCSWCKKMKHRTLADEEVEKRLTKFVVVKVMRDDSDAMAVLPQINGVPAIFFMKEDKTVVEEVIGYFSVEDFLSYINDAEKKIGK